MLLQNFETINFLDYTAAISRNLLFKNFTNLLTKCVTSAYYPNPSGTVIQFWRNPFSLRIKFVDGLVGYRNFGGFKIK